MDTLNLRPVFLPNQRADANTYWLGLGLIAALDALRLTMTDGTGLLPWFIVIIFLSVLHANRLRDAGRSAWALAVPLTLAVVAKFIIALFAMVIDYMPTFMVFLETQGVDITDQAQTEAVVFDPEFQSTHEAYLRENPELVYDMLRAAAWPSTWAFWIVIAVAARWFARLPRKF